MSSPGASCLMELTSPSQNTLLLSYGSVHLEDISFKPCKVLLKYDLFIVIARGLCSLVLSALLDSNLQGRDSVFSIFLSSYDIRYKSLHTVYYKNVFAEGIHLSFEERASALLQVPESETCFLSLGFRWEIKI